MNGNISKICKSSVCLHNQLQDAYTMLSLTAFFYTETYGQS